MRPQVLCAHHVEFHSPPTRHKVDLSSLEADLGGDEGVSALEETGGRQRKMLISWTQQSLASPQASLLRELSTH